MESPYLLRLHTADDTKAPTSIHILHKLLTRVVCHCSATQFMITGEWEEMVSVGIQSGSS
jgi:hypothetical protein